MGGLLPISRRRNCAWDVQITRGIASHSSYDLKDATADLFSGDHSLRLHPPRPKKGPKYCQAELIAIAVLGAAGER